eukprot:gene27179-33454_t
MTARTIVIDLETTGLDTKKAEIISIAARLFGSDEMFSEFVRPTKLPISIHVAKLTRISSNFLATKDMWSLVGTKFCEWIQDKVLEHKKHLTLRMMGHNIRRFDMPILLRHLEALPCKNPITIKRLQVLDTLPLLKYVYPGMKSYRQTFVYEKLFEHPPSLAHSAAGDVNALCKILSHSSSTLIFESKEVNRFVYDVHEYHREQTKKIGHVLAKREENEGKSTEGIDECEQRVVYEEMMNLIDTYYGNGTSNKELVEM